MSHPCTTCGACCTERKPVRCVALEGEIGQTFICRIYEQRSSTCHDFVMGDERYQQARAAHGLDELRNPP